MPDIVYEPRGFIASEAAIRGADYALELKSNGTQIKGALKSDGPTGGMIGIAQWESRIATQSEASSGLSTGRRLHYGLHFIGPVSKAAPLIFKALCNNEVIEATLLCFHQHKSERKKFLTIVVKEGRISTYELLTSPLDGSLLYDFTIAYHTIKQTWEDGGIEHEDAWHGQDR